MSIHVQMNLHIRHHFTIIIVINIILYIYIYSTCREGDVSLIEADAITNSTDETLTEKNIISSRILRRAGPGLREEILNDPRGII